MRWYDVTWAKEYLNPEQDSLASHDVVVTSESRSPHHCHCYPQIIFQAVFGQCNLRTSRKPSQVDGWKLHSHENTTAPPWGNDRRRPQMESRLRLGSSVPSPKFRPFSSHPRLQVVRSHVYVRKSPAMPPLHQVKLHGQSCQPHFWGRTSALSNRLGKLRPPP